MKLDLTELESLYQTLKGLCQNFNSNEIEFYKKGRKIKRKGKIHIKKKNRGKFTASAKRAGQSVLEHARSVLNNPNATPLLKKRANFARNAAKWKHLEGGILLRFKLSLLNNTKSQLLNRGPIKYYLNRGSYDGGSFGGGGAGGPFIYSPQPQLEIKKDTIWIPIHRTFNDAFREATRDSLDVFEFNKKLYNTEKGTNPENVRAGNIRTEVTGFIPIERKSQKYTYEKK